MEVLLYNNQPVKPRRRLAATLAAATLFGTVLGVGTTAYAQQAAPEVNLTPSPIQQLGQTLYNDGIYLNSRYLGEFAGSVSGGQRQGTDYAGELNFGATFDMEKLAGIKGGSFHVLFTQRHGNNLAAQTINNSVSVQQIYGGGQTAQLTIFTYEQKLFDNMVDIEAGRTDMPDSFDVSSFYCDFQSNAICGNPPDMGKITTTNFYAVAVWGGRLLITPTPNLYLKVGAYQSTNNENPDAHHGFYWGTEGSNGYLLPVELGYKWKTPGAIANNRYDIGAIFDRASYTAPYYGPGTYNNESAVYVQGQQMVYQTSPNSPRGVYVFGEAMLGTAGGKQVSNLQAEAGMIWEGPFASRPNDNIGLAVSGIHYNNRYLNSLYQTRLTEGGAGYPDHNLIMTELHYSWQANKWLNIMPNFQYIINPDGQGFSTYSTHNLPNAAVFGIQLYVDLPTLFGIPTKS
ncbi:carbohydrate porin [Acidiphilium acidophilum]|uniref:Carbohydrate porin n=1 Tax=Acidiphilium acidophilum TaxID=76588 RepID=A0AAW9DPY4_ACIAO|nr:carbohydrate porin [Acidiphilium acidophilum]MDX5931063.1 carbohydrate porin [Acidiphilium acidophilum]